MADIYAKENSGGSEGCAVKHKKAELVGNKVNQMVSGREREDTGSGCGLICCAIGRSHWPDVQRCRQTPGIVNIDQDSGCSICGWSVTHNKLLGRQH